MDDPRSTSPGSIMPRYPWLLTAPLSLDDSSEKLKVMTKLGVPYTSADASHAKDNASEQARSIAEQIAAQGGPRDLQHKQIIALVAYLQRLGVDIRKPPQHVVPPTVAQH
jgi:cytochrome c oxidase cbb3-type subunit I/II